MHPSLYAYSSLLNAKSVREAITLQGLSPTRTTNSNASLPIFSFHQVPWADIHDPRSQSAAMTNYDMEYPITRQQREVVYTSCRIWKPRVCGWAGRDMQGVRVRTAGWTIPPARAVRKQDAVQLLVLRTSMH